VDCDVDILTSLVSDPQAGRPDTALRNESHAMLDDLLIVDAGSTRNGNHRDTAILADHIEHHFLFLLSLHFSYLHKEDNLYSKVGKKFLDFFFP
jgi:hypothetical protein